MGRSGRFFQELEQALGEGSVTSGYRTQKEQDDLVARGKTKATRSAHTYNNGYDFKASRFRSEKEARETLAAKGFQASRIIYETGKGRNQGTGAHWHAEGITPLKSGTTAVARTPQGRTDITMEDVLRTVESVRDPEVSQRDNSSAVFTELFNSRGGAEIMNPFDVGGDIKGLYNEAMAEAQNAKTVLDNAIPQIDQLQEAREIALTEAVQRKQDIRSELQANTEAVIQKTKPLFGQRSAIANRQAELAKMNPLKRGFMSLFDASYDRKHLETLDNAVVGQLNATGSEYENNLKLQSQLMEFVSAQYSDADSIAQLVLSNKNEDIALAGQSFAATSRVLGQAMQGLEAQNSLFAAQAQMKQQVLSTMTAGSVGSALNRMGDNDEIDIDGAMVSKAELVDLQKRYQMQELRFEEAQLARETAGINRSAAALRLQDEKENQFLGSLTTAQLQEVAKNGGRYRGQQFDMRIVGDALQRGMQTDQLILGGLQQDQAPKMLQGGIQAVRSSLGLASARAREMFGGTPNELRALQARIANEAQGMANLQNQANRAGKGSIAATAQLEQVARWQQGIEGEIEKMVTRWSGGRKELAPLGRAFLTGSSLSGPAAVDGLISLARNGLPPGSKLSGASAAAYQATQGILKQSSKSKPGVALGDMLNSGDKGTSAAAAQEIRERVGQTVQSVYNGHIFNEALQSSPEIARQIGHAAGQIDPRILSQSIVAGDEEGYRRIADHLKISPEQAKVLFDEGEDSGIWTQVKQANPGANFNQAVSQLKTLQTSAMFNALDSSSPKIQGHRPSAVFVNLLNDQRYQSRLNAAVEANKQGGFTSFVVGSAAGNTFGGQVAQYAQDAAITQSQLQIARQRQTITAAGQYRNNPTKRMAVTLGAVGGINQAEERALLEAIKKVVPETRRFSPELMAAEPSAELAGRMDQDAYFNQMRSAIMSTKFQDPGLERVRSIAAKGIDDALRASDDAIGRFLETEDE